MKLIFLSICFFYFYGATAQESSYEDKLAATLNEVINGSVKSSNGEYKSFGVINNYDKNKIYGPGTAISVNYGGPIKAYYRNPNISAISVKNNTVITFFDNILSGVKTSTELDVNIIVKLMNVVFEKHPAFSDALIDMTFSYFPENKKIDNHIVSLLLGNDKYLKNVNPFKTELLKKLPLILKSKLYYSYLSESNSNSSHIYKHWGTSKQRHRLFSTALNGFMESTEMSRSVVLLESILINEILSFKYQVASHSSRAHRGYASIVLLKLLSFAEDHIVFKKIFRKFILAGHIKVNNLIPNALNHISNNHIFDTYLMKIESSADDYTPIDILNKVILSYDAEVHVDQLVGYSYKRFYREHHPYVSTKYFEEHIDHILSKDEGKVDLLKGIQKNISYNYGNLSNESKLKAQWLRGIITQESLNSLEEID